MRRAVMHRASCSPALRGQRRQTQRPSFGATDPLFCDPTCETHVCGAGLQLNLEPASITGADDATCCDTKTSPFGNGDGSADHPADPSTAVHTHASGCSTYTAGGVNAVMTRYYLGTCVRQIHREIPAMIVRLLSKARFRPAVAVLCKVADKTLRDRIIDQETAVRGIY